MVTTPSGTSETQVAVPRHTGPVEFQTLHLKLRGGIFKVEAGAGIVLLVQEPMHRIYRYANVDSIRFKALSFGRSDHSITFRSSCVIANPLFGPRQVAGHNDRISLNEPSKCLSCSSFFTI